MNVSSIGIQQIAPLTGTAWQNADPSPDRSSGDTDNTPQPAADRAPPSPGTGQLVDKLV